MPMPIKLPENGDIGVAVGERKKKRRGELVIMDGYAGIFSVKSTCAFNAGYPMV